MNVSVCPVFSPAVFRESQGRTKQMQKKAKDLREVSAHTRHTHTRTHTYTHTHTYTRHPHDTHTTHTRHATHARSYGQF